MGFSGGHCIMYIQVFASQNTTTRRKFTYLRLNPIPVYAPEQSSREGQFVNAR